MFNGQSLLEISTTAAIQRESDWFQLCDDAAAYKCPELSLPQLRNKSPKYDESDLQLLIFHDSLDTIEGREKAVATIANAFDASIAAANVDPKFIRELDTEHDDIYDFFRINDRPQRNQSNWTCCSEKQVFETLINIS